MLCHRHIFVEVSPNVFRNNRHSYELRSETGAAEMMLIEYGRSAFAPTFPVTHLQWITDRCVEPRRDTNPV